MEKNTMDTFVARENVRHFCDRLETETDPTVRSRLIGLLVQEEDKLGHDSETLREIESHIAHAKQHVNRQQALLASMQCGSGDIAQAAMLLNAFSDILLTFENIRQRILVRLQQSNL